MSDVTENVARFATFITSMDEGRSTAQSIADAKNVTVNFDMVGSGAMGNAEVRTLFAFSNVAVQALGNTLDVGKDNPKRMAGVIATRLISGAIAMPLINSFLAMMLDGDDDDDKNNWLEEYAKLSPHKRQNHLTFYLGRGNGFLHVPLSQEFRAFNALGESFFMYRNGKTSKTDMMIDFISSASELMVYNPVGSAISGSWADAMPTVAVPAAQIASNKTFYGSRIYNDSPWVEHKPGYLKARKRKGGEHYAPKVLVDLLKQIDNVSSSYPGVIPGTLSLNPDVVHSLMTGYLGGFYTQAVGLIELLSADKSMEEKSEECTAKCNVERP